MRDLQQQTGKDIRATIAPTVSFLRKIRDEQEKKSEAFEKLITFVDEKKDFTPKDAEFIESLYENISNAENNVQIISFALDYLQSVSALTL